MSSTYVVMRFDRDCEPLGRIECQTLEGAKSIARDMPFYEIWEWRDGHRVAVLESA